MLQKWKLAGALVISATLLNPIASQHALAQATYNAQGQKLSGKTHVEKAIGKCLIAMLIGGGLGAAIKGRDGALVGLAAGGVVCALIMKGASDKDKARIRDAQLAALNTNKLQESSWSTDQGASAQLAVMPAGDGSVLMTDKGSLECRRDNQCRVGDSWYPKEQILSRQAAADAPKVVKASFESSRELVCRRSRVVYGVDRQVVSDGTDIACLDGDTWVTSDAFKKQKINSDHVVI
ncbi:hypothetical protein [Novosphingobium sp.]|uniref:hypothetical protein n=1 Tax=Novosphingobium sp. TaxID=1874826 RepID=UPI0033415674